MDRCNKVVAAHVFMYAQKLVHDSKENNKVIALSVEIPGPGHCVPSKGKGRFDMTSVERLERNRHAQLRDLVLPEFLLEKKEVILNFSERYVYSEFTTITNFCLQAVLSFNGEMHSVSIPLEHVQAMVAFSIDRRFIPALCDESSAANLNIEQSHIAEFDAKGNLLAIWSSSTLDSSVTRVELETEEDQEQEAASDVVRRRPLRQEFRKPRGVVDVVKEEEKLADVIPLFGRKGAS